MERDSAAWMNERACSGPFAGLLNIRALKVGKGYALVQMTPGEKTENLFGMVHGGAVLSLIEEAFELASNSHGLLSLPLNISVTFLRPPVMGKILIAEAKELSLGKRTATYSIEVREKEGEMVATCQALARRENKELSFR